MDNLFIIALGFLAQGLFFLRTIVQWFKSEQEGEIISPTIFWQISLLASILMLTYGVFRCDFAIVIGQFLVYSIYIRNLQLKGAWRKMHWLIRMLSIAIPPIYLFWLIRSGSFNSILNNADVTLFWMIWGTLAQIVFVSRFFYQWVCSENKKESVLPLGFWIISTTGSLMIFIYAISRLDAVLFIAHCFGLFIYTRNILLFFGRRSLFSAIGSSSKLNKQIVKVLEKIK